MLSEEEYKIKYLKYKAKYQNLREQEGGFWPFKGKEVGKGEKVPEKEKVVTTTVPDITGYLFAEVDFFDKYDKYTTGRSPQPLTINNIFSIFNNIKQDEKKEEIKKKVNSPVKLKKSNASKNLNISNNDSKTFSIYMVRSKLDEYPFLLDLKIFKQYLNNSFYNSFTLKDKEIVFGIESNQRIINKAVKEIAEAVKELRVSQWLRLGGVNSWDMNVVCRKD
jgi:hypothetical protein